MKEGGHWPPFYFSSGTSLGPIGGVSLQPSCSENGGFLDTHLCRFFCRWMCLSLLSLSSIFQCSDWVN